MKVLVITISDRAFIGEYEDRSGPLIEKTLKKHYENIVVHRLLVPDEKTKIQEAFNKYSEYNYVLTTGGTGIGPRDISASITKDFCDYEIPGIAQILRSESYKETPYAMLSNAYSGIKGKTLIVNFPGSINAVELCTNILAPVMQHSIDMLEGKNHG